MMDAFAALGPGIIAALLVAGIGIGLLAGLLGIGGGVLAVPVLLEVFAATGVAPKLRTPLTRARRMRRCCCLPLPR